jgi:uncharacterized membrane protein
MTKKRTLAISITIFAVAFMVCLSAAPSDAAVKITIKNNRSHDMWLSFCWAGLDHEDDVSKGWYTVKAGESRTITFKDAIYALTSENFGYYATGGKYTWSGNTGSEYMTFWIHPKNAFTGSHDPISGGEKVEFKTLNLKSTSDNREDGAGTLTFNP